MKTYEPQDHELVEVVTEMQLQKLPSEERVTFLLHGLLSWAWTEGSGHPERAARALYRKAFQGYAARDVGAHIRAAESGDKLRVAVQEILRDGWRDEDSGNHYDMLRDIAELVGKS